MLFLSLSLSFVSHRRPFRSPLHPDEFSRLIPNVPPPPPFLGKREMSKTMRFVNAGCYRHLCLVARRIPSKPALCYRGALAVLGDVTEDSARWHSGHSSSRRPQSNASVSGGAANRSLARGRILLADPRASVNRALSSLLFSDGKVDWCTRDRPRPRDGILRFVISLIYLQILSVAARPIGRSIGRSSG